VFMKLSVFSVIIAPLAEGFTR